MSNKVNRESFLQVLESVKPGVASNDAIDQSNCFVFKDGVVYSFDGEVSCRRESGLPKTITGAAKADKMVEQLGKWLDDELTVQVKDKAMVFSAGRREAGFIMEPEIVLPIDEVDEPKSWKKLPEDFVEAVGVVQQCASTDESHSALLCVHLHSEWVEACDNFQACRWNLKTGLKEPILVRRNSIKHITRMGAVEWAETKSWLHFKSSTGLRLACRRYLEDYHDLSSAFEGEGSPVSLPKGLVEACDKASVFSSENVDMDNVEITLSSGKMKVRGQGINGWFSETKKLTYDGPTMSFCASPGVLADLVKRHSDAMIAPGKLIVATDTYKYILHLFVPEMRAGDAVDEPESTEQTEKPEKPKKRKKAAAGVNGEA